MRKQTTVLIAVLSVLTTITCHVIGEEATTESEHSDIRDHMVAPSEKGIDFIREKMHGMMSAKGCTVPGPGTVRW